MFNKLIILSLLLLIVIINTQKAFADKTIECKITAYPKNDTAKLDYKLEDKENYKFLLEEATGAIKINDFKRAEKLLSRAIKIKPKKWQAWQSLAVVYMELKNYKSSKICARTAYELNPKEPINKYTYGIFIKKNESQQAYFDKNNNQIVMSVNSDRNLIQEALKNEVIKQAVYREDPREDYSEFGNSTNKILARVK